MNRRQKAVLIGMILGDAYLQKTGESNARIRLEHSEKQKDYLLWKASLFPEYFPGKPSYLKRFNRHYDNSYRYIRWQSNASPEIGKFRKIFYRNGKKIIPINLVTLFIDPLSLAVWYMDDGYLYHRDKTIYIYLPEYLSTEQQLLLSTLKQNFGLVPILKRKKTGSWVLIFPVQETRKLLSLMSHFIIPEMKFKLLDPVSTETSVSR